MIVFFEMIVGKRTFVRALTNQKLMLKYIWTLSIRIPEVKLKIKERSSSIEISMVIEARISKKLRVLKMIGFLTFASFVISHDDLVLGLFSYLEFLVDNHI